MMVQTSKNARISLQWPFGYHELGSTSTCVGASADCQSVELNNPSHGVGLGCCRVLELYKSNIGMI